MPAPAQGSAVTNTYITTGGSAARGQRESLSNVITRIDPDETPFYSNAKKGRAKAIYEEFQVQELETADENAQPEGFDAAFPAAKRTDRMGNYCQIATRTFIVSGTLDAVDKAGREDEFNYQALLKGLEVRRDVEWSLVRGVAKVGTGSRKLGGIQTWISNGSAGATGALAATPDGSTAPTNGNNRAISLTLISAAMQDAYIDGGKPDMLMLHPIQKRKFSALSGTAGQVAANEYNMTRVTDASIIGSVSVFLTDFGRLDVAVNRIMGSEDGLLIDTDHVEIRTLPGRNFVRQKYAQTGDAQKGGVVWEGTLIPDAPKAHAAVLDLDAT